jgi:hypothetical protein
MQTGMATLVKSITNMSPEASLLSIIPNLSIGALAICGFVYLMVLAHKQNERHHEAQTAHTVLFLTELEKREHAMRGLESEVRSSIAKQLAENTHLMTRIIDYLDQPALHLSTKPRVSKGR